MVSVPEISTDEFDKLVQSKEKVLVDFFAEWCMPCLMMAPIVDELAEQMPKVKFAKVNVDDNPDLAGKFGISSIPCLLFFKNGKEIHRIIGGRTAEDLEEEVKNSFK